MNENLIINNGDSIQIISEDSIKIMKTQNKSTNDINLNSDSLLDIKETKDMDSNSINTISINQEIPIINNPNSTPLTVQDNQKKLILFKNEEGEFIKILRSLSDLTDQQIRIIEVRYLSVLRKYIYVVS